MAHFLILGANTPSLAIIQFLIEKKIAQKITWLTSPENVLKENEKNLRKVLDFKNLKTFSCQFHNPKELQKKFEKADICLNLLPQRYAIPMTKLSLDTNTHYMDRGHHPQTMKQQIQLSMENPNGLNLNCLPGCGFIPGMSGLFAAYCLEKFKKCDSIFLRGGIIPQKPTPPLNCILPTPLEKLTQNYFERTEILRMGEVITVDTFAEKEAFHHHQVPPCEAFLVAGGTGILPWIFKGKVQNLDYKTVHYYGHYQKMKLLNDLGLFEFDPLEMGHQNIIPRQFFHSLLRPKVSPVHEKDFALLRCMATNEDQTEFLNLEIFQKYDSVRKFSAWEIVNSLSMVTFSQCLIQGKLPPGPGALEEKCPPKIALNALQQNGIPVSIYQGSTSL